MPEQQSYPLKFTCTHCNHANVYPNFLVENNTNKTQNDIVKRCLNCGKENTIKIPDGWIKKTQESIYREFE